MLWWCTDTSLGVLDISLSACFCYISIGVIIADIKSIDR